MAYDGRFPTSRESPNTGDIIEWARSRMTRGIKVLSDHAEEIGQVGVEAVQNDIEQFGRVDPNHSVSKDGPESMVEGVHASINKATSDENSMSVRVGWDLTQYRDGYPELQDKGFNANGTAVIGMQALALGKMRMREAVIQALNEGLK